MLAQALIGSIGPIIVFVGGFIGLKLAPSAVLATLPVASMVVGIALFMMPATKMLAKLGRKAGFFTAIILGIANSLFCAFAIYIENFWLFCSAILLYGITLATVQQFRFAAMESVAPEKGGSAVSVLLLAGLIAAFLGPEIAFAGKDFFAIEFVGSFLGIAVLLSLSLIFVSFYQQIEMPHSEQVSESRPLSVIAKQPIFLASIICATVGFSVMSFVMTATPISMHVHSGFDMAATKWVIQSHIIAMYLPSFFTGNLIRRFGQSTILYCGIIALLICIAIGFAGQQYVHYWFALVLLGIGWNFMFVTATAILPASYRPEEKFKVQGFNDTVMFSCQALASLSAGWVINTLGWNMLLVICIPLLLTSAFMVLTWQRTSRVKTSSSIESNNNNLNVKD